MEAVIWKPGRVVADFNKSTFMSYFYKSARTGLPSIAAIIRNPRDVSIIYAADELHINTPEHYAQVTNNV